MVKFENMKRIVIPFVLLISSLILSCGRQDGADKKVWAWMSGKTTMTPDQWEHYFKNASDAGIDAIILECHGGYPEVLGDSTAFRDSAAIFIVKRALEFSQKYNIELHAWLWTTNRTEMSLRNAHPDWYQVNAKGESCLDIKLYNREHYRWLCPSRPEAIEYLKDRVAELAEIDGLAGVHMDFIRYPDAILPYGLHASRNVIQDRVYPLWDFCYCDECRKQYKEKTGVDPMDIDEPTSDEQWMQFRWDALANMASEVAKEIKAHGKISSAAVFASPEESKKLVRQDWANFKNVDVLLPMIYHKFYDWEDKDVERATREGVEALKISGSKAYLTSGLFVGHVPKERINEFFDYAKNGGSKGICLFSLELVDRTEGYWEKLKEAISIYKQES